MKERTEAAQVRHERRKEYLREEARRLGVDPEAYVLETLLAEDGAEVDDMPDGPAKPSAKFHPGSETQH